MKEPGRAANEVAKNVSSISWRALSSRRQQRRQTDFRRGPAYRHENITARGYLIRECTGMGE
jgi:hypothetical protein